MNKPKGSFILNAIDTTLPNEKETFVPLGAVGGYVGHFIYNCSYPLRSKVDFQVERFKLLAIGSVPFRRERQIMKIIKG
uniref:Uncharacterized protein n=1 Tax=Romanomermis culicivorax TaxID=13658 RepID=A0A915HK47_ROMCU